MIVDYNFDNKSLDDSSKEGKLLIAALAILTTIDNEDIGKGGRYGRYCTPFEVLDKVVDLANKIYYEEDYKHYLQYKKRKEIIDTIVS